MALPTNGVVASSFPARELPADSEPPENLPRSPSMTVRARPSGLREDLLALLSEAADDDGDLIAALDENDPYLSGEFSSLLFADGSKVLREDPRVWRQHLTPLAKSLVELGGAGLDADELAEQAARAMASADLSAVDACYGRSVLHWACLMLPASLVKLLLSKGADVLLGLSDMTGRTPLRCAHEKRVAPGGAEVIEALLDAGVSLEQLDHEGAELLYRTDLGPALAARLLRLGAEPNGGGRFQVTPLVCACAEGRWGVASVLLDFGADIRRPGPLGTSVLHQAGLPVWLAEQLWRLGADVNARDLLGETPLMLACEVANIPYMRWLIGKGALPDAVDDARISVAEYAGRGGEAVRRWMQQRAGVHS